MKIKYFKTQFQLAALAIIGAASMIASCSESIEVGNPINEGDYGTINQNNGFLCDANSSQASNEVEIYEASYTATLKLGLSKAPTATTFAKVQFDAAYLDVYNKEHGTNFELYPADKVTLDNEGVLKMSATRSYFAGEVKITIAGAEGLEDDAVYAVPVTIVEHSADINIPQSGKNCIYLVKNRRSLSNCFKGDDLPKGFLFFEVNDVNPLNTLAFELENGKLVWDVIVLFAANINYDSAAGRPYVQCNPNVRYLLDHNEEFLQPLRKRGIKVLLGLLGNHDQAGLAQLSKTGAQDFARELAEYCRAYNLDGVNFDDEYSNAPDLSNPAFAPLSTAAGARLCYETKLLMPNKEVTVFDWGSMYGTATVDGVQAKEWIDVVVANYGSSAGPIGGMTRKNCSGVSMEFWQGRYSMNASTAQSLLTNGYGWFMGFAPHPQNFAEGIRNFPSNNIHSRLSGCETLYGSKVKKPTIFYRKDDPKPYRFPEEFRNEDYKN